MCAAPGKPYLLASFIRDYNRAAEEVRQRQVEAETKALALAKENQAAMKAGKLNFEAYQAAMGKIAAEGERDNGARFRFRMGGNDPTPAGSGGGFSPVTVPVGKGYRQVSSERRDARYVDDRGQPGHAGEERFDGHVLRRRSRAR